MGNETPQLSATSEDSERRKAALLQYKSLQEQFFPQVPNIFSEELLELFKSNAIGNSVIIVDCRSSEERKVSMYKGAISMADFEKNISEYKDKEIVPYCAIGRRSGNFAQKLLAAYPGIKVRNHAGSLVDWAHAGGPLVKEGTEIATNEIHPNGTWIPYMPLSRNLELES